MFVWFNYPYIFSRRMRNGELEKYGISQENARAILAKIMSCGQQGIKVKTERLASDSELSTYEHSLGKRSPTNSRIPPQRVGFERPQARSDSFDFEFHYEEIESEENIPAHPAKAGSKAKLRFLGNNWYRIFKKFMDQNSGDLEEREAAKLRCKLCKFFERKSPVLPLQKLGSRASILSNNQSDKLLRFEDILHKVCSDQNLHMSGSVNEIIMPLRCDIEIIVM